MVNVYRSVNMNVLERVPQGVHSLLDLGCGAGDLGQAIKSRLGCTVTGVTYSPQEAELATTALDRVFVEDLETLQTHPLGTFDCIVCSHVLEHLRYPDKLLQQLHANLNPEGVLLIALPNVLFWKQRLEFLAGRFRYTEGGIMDSSHFRFYDWKSATALIVACGYSFVRADCTSALPLARMVGSLPLGWGTTLQNWVSRSSLGLFGYEFLFVCRSNS
jgi:2-polyprenyl-3-methyl-5-hydroxy-6-metoxy-1,4-benzoquinol methylase